MFRKIIGIAACDPTGVMGKNGVLPWHYPEDLKHFSDTIFGTPLRVTMRNNLDGLAAATVFCMGEGNEQTPFAIVTKAPKIEFQQEPPTEAEVQELSIPMNEDLYGPLLKNARWVFQKG